MSYKELAESKGYSVGDVLCSHVKFWFNDELEILQRGYSESEEDCWKACCVENNLGG